MNFAFLSIIVSAFLIPPFCHYIRQRRSFGKTIAKIHQISYLLLSILLSTNALFSWFRMADSKASFIHGITVSIFLIYSIMLIYFSPIELRQQGLLNIYFAIEWDEINSFEINEESRKVNLVYGSDDYRRNKVISIPRRDEESYMRLLAKLRELSSKMSSEKNESCKENTTSDRLIF